MINSRQKGKRGELELAQLLRTHGFAKAARGQQFKGGSDSPDVTGLDGWHIECKRVESGNPYTWLNQAHHDASQTATPVVFHKRNAGRWIVILAAEDFLAMLDKPAA